MQVDQYGNGVASAPGVKGGHVSAAHNWINFDTMTQVVNSGVLTKGNNRVNICNGAYKGSLNVGTETRGDDDIEKNLQKMIPYDWIGRIFLDAPFNSPPNRLDDRETFVEFKTLASLAMTPNVRAQQVQSDIEKRAHDLDLKYPGSTFTQVLNSHGKER